MAAHRICGLFFMEVWNPFKFCFFWWLHVGGGRKRKFVFAVTAEMFACLGIFQEMFQICWSDWSGHDWKVCPFTLAKVEISRRIVINELSRAIQFVQDFGKTFCPSRLCLFTYNYYNNNNFLQDLNSENIWPEPCSR